MNDDNIYSDDDDVSTTSAVADDSSKIDDGDDYYDPEEAGLSDFDFGGDDIKITEEDPAEMNDAE